MSGSVPLPIEPKPITTMAPSTRACTGHFGIVTVPPEMSSYPRRSANGIETERKLPGVHVFLLEFKQLKRRDRGAELLVRSRATALGRRSERLGPVQRRAAGGARRGRAYARTWLHRPRS